MKSWFQAAAVRAVKTIAQTAVALIGTTTFLHQIDWTLIASASVLAGILSLLTSVAGLPELSSGHGDDTVTISSRQKEGH